MNTAAPRARRATARDMHFFENPQLWPHRPFLPVIRQEPENGQLQLGVLYDARQSGAVGYCCTVFLTNLYDLPLTEAELLSVPRLVYDTFDELAGAGWVVD